MVVIILGNGFEESEALVPCDILRRAGVDVRLCGINSLNVTGGHEIQVICDIQLSEIAVEDIEMLVLPGGLAGVASIQQSEAARSLISSVYASGKWLAAICAAPTILADLHITDGHLVTCYPGMECKMGNAVCVPETETVTDGHIITGTSAASAFAFGFQLLNILKGREAVEAVSKAIVYRS